MQEGNRAMRTEPRRMNLDMDSRLVDFRGWTEEELERWLEAVRQQIISADSEVYEQAAFRWSKVAKPLNSLGILEEDIMKIASVQGTVMPNLEKKALVLFCADNGVVEEGVTQTGQDVTAAVTANFTRGESCSCLMAERAGADVIPVDIGVASDLGPLGKSHPLIDRKIRRGTHNFTKEPSMSRREAMIAFLTGVDLVRVLKRSGYGIVATGEMGIGNTTTSSAVAAVLLDEDPAKVTGKGAGLSEEGLARKLEAIRTGIRQWNPNPGDGLDILSKVGGFDLAGLAGVFFGGAVYRLPVVIDGLISAAAAAVAAVMDCRVKEYMLAAHVSAEPAGEGLLRFLEQKPVIQAGLCLGEGTGALALLPLLDMALAVYRKMCTFSEMEIEEYKPL